MQWTLWSPVPLFQHSSVCVSQASAEPVEKEEPFLLPAQAYKPKNWAAPNRRSRKERWEEQRFSRVDCPWNWTSVLKLLHWRGRYGLKDIACCRPQAASKVQGLGRILLRNLSCHTSLCTGLGMITLFPLSLPCTLVFPGLILLNNLPISPQMSQLLSSLGLNEPQCVCTTW